MKKSKGLFGGIVLILIGLCLIFPPIFSVLSKYFLVVIGIYLIFTGFRRLLGNNHGDCCRFFHKDLD